MITQSVNWFGLHSRESRRILRVSLISTLILSIAMIALSIWNLNASAQKREQSEIKAMALVTALIVEQYLDKISDTTLQITSRSVIRAELEKFNQGKIELQALREFSTPKLQDALHNSSYALGMVRLSPRGDEVARIGRDIPGNLLNHISHTGLIMQRYVDERGEQYVIVAAPILNHEKKSVGTDFVLFGLDSLISRLSHTSKLGSMANSALQLRHAESGDLMIDLAPLVEARVASQQQATTLQVEQNIFNSPYKILLVVDALDVSERVHSSTRTELGYMLMFSVAIFLVITPALHTALKRNDNYVMQMKKTQAELRNKIAEGVNLQIELQHMATCDALTGLLNRGEGEKKIIKELERSARYQRPFSVLMLDLDHFKKINDTWGHPVGDQVLMYFSKIMENNVRHTDVAIRYGGEEFVVLLPETDVAEAIELATRICHATDQAAPILSDFPDVHVTVSIGVASFPVHGSDLGTLMSTVDRALYEAKHSGRNKVVLAS